VQQTVRGLPRVCRIFDVLAQNPRALLFPAAEQIPAEVMMLMCLLLLAVWMIRFLCHGLLRDPIELNALVAIRELPTGCNRADYTLKRFSGAHRSAVPGRSRG
jgi:hypothetical protein